MIPDSEYLPGIRSMANTEEVPETQMCACPGKSSMHDSRSSRNNKARMAESVDAADLKSADRKVVGVQVPLRARGRFWNRPKAGGQDSDPDSSGR